MLVNFVTLVCGNFLFLANSTNCVFSSVSGRWFQVPQSLSLTYPIDNSEINIRAGGQLFPVGKKSVCTSVSDLSEQVETVETEYKSYQSHENLDALDERNRNNEELLKAIDKTLLQFGMNDNCAYDSNMNDRIEERAPGLFEQLTSSKSTNTAFPLRKSKSAPNPFKNARIKAVAGKSAAAWCLVPFLFFLVLLFC